MDLKKIPAREIHCPGRSENIGHGTVRSHDKCRVAAIGTCTHTEMTVFAKILMEDDCIVALTDRAGRKAMVNHSCPRYLPGYKKEIAVGAGPVPFGRSFQNPALRPGFRETVLELYL